MKLLRRALDFVLYGRLCSRCGQERTGHWRRYVTGVPFDEFDCTTCMIVDEIDFRAQLEKWYR